VPDHNLDTRAQPSLLRLQVEEAVEARQMPSEVEAAVEARQMPSEVEAAVEARQMPSEEVAAVEALPSVVEQAEHQHSHLLLLLLPLLLHHSCLRTLSCAPPATR
jgi:hypothetical protein